MPNNGMYPYQNNIDMYQRRLNGMANQIASGQNNFSNYSQNNQHNTFSQNFNVRAVTGYEEVLASQIPLDGSISIFTDFSHGNIYTKQLNMNDGTALMKTYKLGDNPTTTIGPVENSIEYVKKSEFDELKNRFDEVWEALTDKKSQPKSEKKEGK